MGRNDVHLGLAWDEVGGVGPQKRSVGFGLGWGGAQ